MPGYKGRGVLITNEYNMEKQIATYKKNLVKHFKYVLDESNEQEAFINDFFKEYVRKGTPSFQKVLIVFGEEEKTDFDSLGVVEKQVYGFAIPESVLAFAENKNSKNYQKPLTKPLICNSRYFHSVCNWFFARKKR